MEDLSSQPNTYRRPRTYRRSSVIFNPAADVLAGIEYVEGAFKERRAKVNLFQAQAEQRRIDMQKAVDDTKRIDETDAMAEMTAQFSNMVTDLYKADIASFDGDRSDYLKMYNNAQSVIGNFGKVIGVVDELSNKYTSMNPAEQKKMVLRSQFVGDDAETKKAYVDFLNDPSKMNIRIQGKDIIITNNGKDLFNGTQLLNSVKAGSNLIEYAGDYTKEIESASKEAMTGVKNLVVAKQYETMSDDGSTLYTTAEKNYIDAVNAYIDNLESSDKIQALINESTFQRFTDNSDVYDEAKHSELTKQKMIDFLVNKEFPMYDAEKETAIGDKKITSERITTKDKKEKEKDLTTEEKFDFSLIESIQDQSINAFKNQKEVPSTLETKAKGALLRDFKNKEIKIGGSRYQIYDFDVMRNDDGTLKFQPLIVDMRTKEKIPAPVTYDVNKIIDFANDLEQGGDLQYNVVQVSTPQEAMKLNPGSVFSLKGKKYIVTKRGSVKPID